MPPQVVHVKDAGKVASALANEKCQRILEHLRSHEDATETELAKELEMAASTVHYNMKILVDAKLVHTDTFTYSSKGKEMIHYRLNRNPIVIVQAREYLSLLKTVTPAAIIAAAAGTIYELAKRSTAAAGAPAKQALRTMQTEPVALEGAQMLEAAADAAPTVADAAAQTGPSVLPWFLAGVLAVVVAIALVALARNALQKRNGK